MNGKIKFHHADGPAFAKGEQWIGTSGCTYEVLSTRRYGTDKWDVEVYYCLSGTTEPVYHKDAWNFQVRYTHIADLVV